MITMAKKRTPGETPQQPTGDRHKKQQTQLRLHPIIRQQLDKLVERRVSTLAEEITEAIRKHLKEHGLWPPPSADESATES